MRRGTAISDVRELERTLPPFKAYTRDALGRIATHTETVDGGTTTAAYGYDAAGRLETVTRDGVLAVTYQYDANGNRLARITPGGAATGTPDKRKSTRCHARVDDVGTSLHRDGRDHVPSRSIVFVLLLNGRRLAMRGGRAWGKIAAVGLVLAAGAASGRVLCEKRSGVVVARAECKRRETALDLASFGAVGPTGPTGADGPLPATLPSGKTLVGGWVAKESSSTAGQYAVGQISFPFPLATAPTGSVIPMAGQATAECPGSADAPTAAAGHLCVYVAWSYRATDPVLGNLFALTGASRFGASVEINLSNAVDGLPFVASGTWAVTAP